MADQDLIHTSEIIKAAVPYFDSKTKGLADLFAKLLDFMGSFKQAGKSGNVAATGFQASNIDIEGLLKGIRPICNTKEREFVDRILNIFNIKRMFEMYNNLMSTMKTMQEFGGFNFSDSGTDTDNVTGNFTSANFESIFKNAGFNPFSGNSNSSAANDSNEASNNLGGTDNSFRGDSSDTDSSPKAADFFKSESSQTADFSGSAPSGAASQSASAGTSENTSNNSFAGNGMNSKMFDILKTMVPPEQQSTFENLSMLLNAMSYDNNSKTEESKERNDG